MAEVTENDIRLRFAEVDDLMARHETALVYLTHERMELEAAIRVFDRFHQRTDYSSSILPPKVQQPEPETKKPADIPKMPNMILDVLSFAHLCDGAWMEPKAIAEEIRKRWWPDAPLTSVGPIAWRMAKEGRLKKDGSLYTIPENEAPAGDTAGASEPQEGNRLPNLL